MERQIYWAFLLIFVWGCSSISSSFTGYPTPTPSFPARTVKAMHDFPWQESWHLPMLLLSFEQNMRNLIAVKNGVVHMDGNWLKFVDADQGNQKWAVKLEGRIDSMVTDGRIVYVVGKAGQIVEGYNLQTGELAWKANTTLPGHTGYYLQLQDNNLYAYEAIDLVYVFDTESGELVNKLRVPGIGQKPFTLLQLENKDWLQSDGKQIILTRNEEVIWRTNLAGPPQKFPQIYDDMLIVRFENDRTVFGGLVGLDLTTGKLVWEHPGEFYSNFVIADNLLYVISKEAEILLLDPKTGQTVGVAELLPSSVDTFHPISAISVNESMLYVYFTDSQELIAFKRK
jgi:outer membrane protein assembly factor BamB